MPQLLSVTVSTRPGRQGPLVASWFEAIARDHGAFDLATVDLAELALPLFDEPSHPRRQQYQHAHTKAWSAHVAAADAIVFVMPEYNFSPAPSFTNALDYLFVEWAYKPVAFVTYGGASGGMRALQAARLQVAALRMVPLVESVSLQRFSTFVGDEGTSFTPDEAYHRMTKQMLDELRRWSDALQVLRAPQPDAP